MEIHPGEVAAVLGPERVYRLFLWHLWAFLGVLALWLTLRYYTETGHAPFRVLWALYLLGVLYVAVRTYFVWRRPLPPTWQLAWLVLDIALISVVVNTEGMSGQFWVAYLVPIFLAAASQRFYPTLAICLLAAVAHLAAVWTTFDFRLHFASFILRLAFIFLFGSFATILAQEQARLREQLAVSEYRRRLAHEMHDGVQHTLVQACYNLDLACHYLKEDPHRAASIGIAQRHVIRQAVAELRYLIHRLRSPVLEPGGFVRALDMHLRDFARASSINHELVVRGQERPLPPGIEHALFRIVQEATTNAVKHAQPSCLRVELEYTPDRVACAVRDDGEGFDPGALAEEGGVGLESMRERAGSLHGELCITSSPGQGTEVRVAIPLNGSASVPM